MSAQDKWDPSDKCTKEEMYDATYDAVIDKCEPTDGVDNLTTCRTNAECKEYQSCA